MNLTAGISEEEKKVILQHYRKLLNSMKLQLQKGDRRLLRLAFEVAYDAHRTMRRKSGEPYIMHPLAVAQIVAKEIGLGTVGVMCALLHDVVEDTEVTLDDVEREFGKKVAEIIEGLTKISVIFDVHGYIQAENIRKIMLTLSKDVRVILIKLADRLHNMRTMDSMLRHKQIKIASETIYFYVPLAHRLGLYEIKSELEDLAMKYSEPKIYQQIEAKLKESKKERDRFITEFIKPIKEELARQEFHFEIYGRLKSIYSIWRKMREKSIPFEEVYDKFAIRIIINSNDEDEKTDCWRIYSIITDTYRPNPDRLRDWISNPKANGYEALHTTVMGPRGIWVEVQIRSARMNEIAEKGYAAHFKYKEKTVSDTSVDDWLKKVREILENPDTNTLDFIDDFKLNLFADEIYVFTPKGELKVMPARSSVLDFAFEIHSDIGIHCLGAKVNHQIKPLSYLLQNGDQVEVLTSKKTKPTDEWLSIAVTAKAKSKIKDVLKTERNRIMRIGRLTLEEVLREKKVSFNSHNLKKVLDFFHFANDQDLFYSIGIGNFKVSDMEHFVKVGDNIELKNNDISHQNLELEIKNKLVSNANMFVFGDDHETIDYNLAGCCKPIPGDDVFGFINHNKEIEIHRTNCQNAVNLISKYGYDIVRTKWTRQHQIAFLTAIKISGIDDVGIMLKITSVISGELKVNMQSITLDTKDGLFEGIIKIFVRDTAHLQELMNRLRELSGILSVSRFEEAAEPFKQPVAMARF